VRKWSFSLIEEAHGVLWLIDKSYEVYVHDFVHVIIFWLLAKFNTTYKETGCRICYF
jgi:hypothetical protein